MILPTTTIESAVIEIRYIDNSVEEFTLEAPNGQFLFGARKKVVRGDYRDKNKRLRKGVEFYDLFWNYEYESHRMDLRKLLIAESILLRTPPNYLEQDYQEFRVRLQNAEAIKTYLANLPTANTNEDILPSADINLEFKTVQPLGWNQLLNVKWFQDNIIVQPDPPSNLEFDLEGDTVVFTWQDNQFVDGYNLYLKVGAQPFEKHNVLPIPNLTYTIEGLADNNYQAYVVAVRQISESEESNTVAFIVGEIEENVSALNFNGAGYVNTTIPANFGNPNGISALFYLYLPPTAPSSAGIIGRLGQGSNRFYVDYTSNAWRVGVADNFQNQTSKTIIKSMLNFCCLTYNRAEGTAQFYANGQLVYELTGLSADITTDQFWIAMRDGVSELTGRMDEVAIIKRHLDRDGYMAFAYNTAALLSDADLAHFWKFDNESAVTTSDTITGIEAIIEGTPLVSLPLFNSIERQQKVSLQLQNGGYLLPSITCDMFATGNHSIVISFRRSSGVSDTIWGTIGDGTGGGTRFYFDTNGDMLRLGIGDSFWELGYEIANNRWYRGILEITENDVAFWLDGELLDQRGWSGNIAAFPFAIGTRTTDVNGGTSATLQWGGEIAEVGIFNTLLGPARRGHYLHNVIEQADDDVLHLWNFEGRVPGGFPDLIGSADAMDTGEIFTTMEVPRMNISFVGRSDFVRQLDGDGLAVLDVPAEVEDGDMLLVINMARRDMVQVGDGFTLLAEQHVTDEPDWLDQRTQFWHRVWNTGDPMQFTFEIDDDFTGHGGTHCLFIYRSHNGNPIEVDNILGRGTNDSTIPQLQSENENVFVVCSAAPVGASSGTNDYQWPDDYDVALHEPTPALRLTVGNRPSLAYFDELSGIVSGLNTTFGNTKLAISFKTK